MGPLVFPLYVEDLSSLLLIYATVKKMWFLKNSMRSLEQILEIFSSIFMELYI